MSVVISVKLNDREQDILLAVSAAYGCGVSSLIKKLVFAKLEDEYDLQLAQEYEQAIAAGTLRTRPFSQLKKELRLD